MSDSASSPSLVITDIDKRGAVVVVSVVLLSFLIVAFLTRIYVRLRVSGPWSYDDTTLSVATVVGVGQSIAVFLEVREGFGQTASALNDTSLLKIGQADYASSILYLISLCLSKCSVIALIMRLTTVRKHKVVAWINIGVAVVWSLSSILVITIKCSPAAPFTDLEGQCPGLVGLDESHVLLSLTKNPFSRWVYVCALDIASEISIFCLSIYLVAGLQMAMKMKTTVVMAFALRLPVIGISAARLYYLNEEVDSTDPTLTGYNAAIWTQVQVSYSLLATAAACLGPFLRPFTKPYLADTRYSGQGSRGRSIPQGYDMSKLSSSGAKNSRSSKSHKSGNGQRNQKSAQSDYGSDRLRPDPVSHESHITARQSLDSHDSKRMIITKNMEWRVEYDGGEPSARRDESIETKST